MNFEIYAYWNTVELAATFNAIASITGSGGFNGLLKTLAMVAILSLVITVLAGKGKMEDFWKWLFLVAIFHSMLLVPKVSVQIIDRTGTSPITVVGNVPLGIASLAHSTSKIGDWLTTTYETVFALPDDVQLRKNGTLFGHRVMREINAVKFTDPVLQHDIMEFYRECIWPDIGTGFLKAKDVLASPDIWSLFASSNPGLFVTLRGSTAGTPAINTMTCAEAYTALTPRLVVEATNILTSSGKKFYPTLSAVEAKNAFAGSLSTIPNYFMGISSGATALIQQGMVANSIIDAGYIIPSQLGDAATSQVKLAQAQAIRSFNTSNSTAIALADSTMPKLRNAIEIVIYALFPIIVLIIVIAGQHALTFLRTYVGALLWVQLWAPLYAVVNFIMNTKAASGLNGAVGTSGLALENYHYLGSSMANDQAVAGVLTVAIPVIAYGIVQATMSAASAITQSMGAGAAYGAAASQGNVNMGNTSMNTTKMDMATLGQYNTSPTMNTGAPTLARMGSNGIKSTTFGNGEGVVDASGSMHKLGTSLELSEGVKQIATKASEESESSSIKQATDAAKSTDAVLNQARDFVKSHAKDEAAGKHFDKGATTKVEKALHDVAKLDEKWAESQGLTQQQGNEVMAMASAGAMVAGNGVSTTINGKTSAQTAQAFEAAKSYLKSKDRTDAVASVVTATQSSTYDTKDASGRSGKESIAAEFKKSNTLRESSQASHDKAMSIKDSLSKATENGTAWKASLDSMFMKWETNRPANGATERKLTQEDVAYMSVHDPMKLRADAQQFLKENEDKFMAQLGVMKTSEDIKGNYKANAGEVKAEANIKGQNQKNQATVSAAQSNAGVNPNSRVASDLPGQVNATQAAANGTIENRGKAIAGEGSNMHKKVEENVDPTKSTIGLVMQNAGFSVLGGGPIALINKGLNELGTGLDDRSTLTNELIAKYGDNTGAMLAETAGMAGGVLAGGVGGRMVGKVAGEALSKVMGKEVVAHAEGLAAREVLTAQKAADLAATKTTPLIQAASKTPTDKALQIAASNATKESTAANAVLQSATKREADLLARNAAVREGTVNTGRRAGTAAGVVAGSKAGSSTVAAVSGVNGSEDGRKPDSKAEDKQVSTGRISRPENAKEEQKPEPSMLDTPNQMLESTKQKSDQIIKDTVKDLKDGMQKIEDMFGVNESTQTDKPAQQQPASSMVDKVNQTLENSKDQGTQIIRDTLGATEPAQPVAPAQQPQVAATEPVQQPSQVAATEPVQQPSQVAATEPVQQPSQVAASGQGETRVEIRTETPSGQSEGSLSQSFTPASNIGTLMSSNNRPQVAQNPPTQGELKERTDVPPPSGRG